MNSWEDCEVECVRTPTWVYGMGRFWIGVVELMAESLCGRKRGCVRG